VQDANYGVGGLTVVAAPTTMRALRKAARPGSLAEIVPDVREWVPSTAMPAGTALVGDFTEGAALFLSGDLVIDLAPSFSNYFTKGLILATLSVPAVFDVTTDAFAKVTNIA
jgi:hypothetical protein